MKQGRYIDAYKYLGQSAIRYTDSRGSMVLRKGTIFYYSTGKDKKGDFISLSPTGIRFKLSQKSFDRLSERSKAYLVGGAASTKVVLPSDDSKRTFKSAVQYQVALLKKKTFILTTLRKFLTVAIPNSPKIDDLMTLTSTALHGQIGVVSEYKGVTYKLAFYLGVNTFFSYSVWVPRKLALKEDDLPQWSRRLSKRIPDMQMAIFEPLRLRLNRVNKHKSIVALPSRGFDGTIYQWSTKV